MNIVELRDLGITTTLTESGKLHLEARAGLMTPVLRELRDLEINKVPFIISSS